MTKLDRPRNPTVKRLFAVSGNQCAFPSCTNSLIDEASGKVTGKICHIKGNKPNSKRYAPEQSDEERHGFRNLVLMCPIHHDVIDADDVAYTVDRLQRLKEEHEKYAATVSEPSDEVAVVLTSNSFQNTAIGGSVINSTNQMGGQVAHSITNVGPQPRKISVAAGEVLVAELVRLAPERFDVSSMMGNAESEELALVLKQLLIQAGWTIGTESQSMYNSTPREILISSQKNSEAIILFVTWLHRIGLQVQQTSEPFFSFSEDPAPVHVVVGQGM